MWQPGSAQPAAQSFHVYSIDRQESASFAVAAATGSGGKWLSVTPSSGTPCAPRSAPCADPVITASVDPTGLTPGTYRGSITLTPVPTTVRPNVVPTVVTVALTVGAAPPALSATPSSIFSLWPGSVGAYICVKAGSTAVMIDAHASTSDGSDWLKIVLGNPVTFTCGLTVSLDGSKLAPGTYNGSIVVTVPGQSLPIPVTLVVPPPPQPVIGSVVNAASTIAGAVAPGEIVTIHGVGIGPQSPMGFTTDSHGKVATTLGGAQVLFDGVAAPLLSASATELDTIVPHEIADNATTTVEAEYNGIRVPAGGFVVTQSAPAIFTADSSGQGQAKASNADNSPNSSLNPAARGSVIQLFATGEGVTALPITVQIGDADAVAQDAVSSPAGMPGILRVYAVIPPQITPGETVPVVLTVGGAHSQDKVTIAVK